VSSVKSRIDSRSGGHLIGGRLRVAVGFERGLAVVDRRRVDPLELAGIARLFAPTRQVVSSTGARGGTESELVPVSGRPGEAEDAGLPTAVLHPYLDHPVEGLLEYLDRLVVVGAAIDSEKADVPF